MGMAPATPIVLRYLALGALGGRGGVVRFFMLTHHIPFTEKLYAKGAEWAGVKAELVASGDNPAGKVPVVEYGDQLLTQHVATMRYLARERSITSGSNFGDYVQDVVADEYQGFRDAWVASLGDAEKKKLFAEEKVPNTLKVFEGLYAKYQQDPVFMSTTPETGRPLWGDSALFGLTRDMVMTGVLEEEGLSAFPKVQAMYNAYRSQPAVAEWIASKSET